MSSRLSTSVSLVAPKRARSRKATSGTVSVVLPAASVRASKQRRRPRRARRLRTPQLTAYFNSLRDPFCFPGVHLGFRTARSTALSLAYTRLIVGATDSTTNAMKIIFNPDAAMYANSGGATDLLNSFVSIQEFLGTTLVSTDKYDSLNRSALVAQFESYRIVSAGVRVWVSYPMTSAGPVIASFDASGVNASTNFDTLTPSNVDGFPSTRLELARDGGGYAVGTWLPLDFTDLEFANASSNNNGEGLYNVKVISLNGYPVGTRVYIEAIVHVEGLTGSKYPTATGSGETDNPSQPTVADEVPESSIFKEIKNFVYDVLANVDMTSAPPPLMGGARTINRLMQGYNMGPGYQYQVHNNLLQSVVPDPSRPIPEDPSPPPSPTVKDRNNNNSLDDDDADCILHPSPSFIREVIKVAASQKK